VTVPFSLAQKTINRNVYLGVTENDDLSHLVGHANTIFQQDGAHQHFGNVVRHRWMPSFRIREWGEENRCLGLPVNPVSVH